jgi:hypothetical protein
VSASRHLVVLTWEMSFESPQRELPRQGLYPVVSADGRYIERHSGNSSLTKTEEIDSILVLSMGSQTTKLIGGDVH